MFDRIQFDRNAFDRSVSSDDGIRINISASGSLQTIFNFNTPFFISLTGSGHFQPGLYASAIFGIVLSGDSEMFVSTVQFYNRLPTSIHAVGSMSVGLVMRIPIGTPLNGTSSFVIDNRVLTLQNLNIGLSGSSSIDLEIQNSVFIDEVFLSSSGTMNIGQMAFSIPLSAELYGSSLFTLRRLSALNEKSLMLENINLLPGETIIIDTDLLIVLLNNIEDVSSVTTDSVFFELFPGDNEIIVDTDSNVDLNVTAIWQNRWL